MQETVSLEMAGTIARLAIDRPHAANTIDLETAAALGEAIDRVVGSRARVLIIGSTGRSFCGGGDLGAVARSGEPELYLERLAGAFHEVIAMLDAAPMVVVCDVRGAAAGGGLGLVLASDIAFATPGATFRTAYDLVGLTPDSAVSLRLPRAVGERRALAMSMSGRAVDAHTAQAWGLIHEVVDDGDVDARVSSLARQLANGPVDHLVASRSLFRAACSRPLGEQLAAEQAQIVRAAAAPAARAAIEGFSARGMIDGKGRR